MPMVAVKCRAIRDIELVIMLTEKLQETLDMTAKTETL